MRITIYYVSLAFFLLLWGCQTDSPKEEEKVEIPEFLPMNDMSTNTLEAFQTDGKNWQVFGEVYADLNEKQVFETVEGQGVLANMQTEEDRSHIFSKMEHGDLELEIDFLMPKESNSGIYFQSRYEIQLFDSWGVEEPHHSDCGGIYQRWDESRPEGEKGYEGHAPRINASRAPGLWQHFHIMFKAPKFDEAGNKIANARFDKVYHNGVLIHENVELTGPTRAAAHEDEVPLAPLMIQGDHGKVAFRNIKFKAYGQDTLKVSNLQYTLYEHDTDQLPESFDSLKVTAQGSAENFNVADLSEKNDYYAAKYTGELEVPVDGEYLFETFIDDAGDFSIDGNVVVHNIGDPGGDIARGVVNLTKGTHPIEMTFHQVVWGATIVVNYEGPGIAKRPLYKIERPSWQRGPQEPILVKIGEEAEMVRGFVMHDGIKRTHTISVGDPEGVHYSYDLEEGSLLKFWRGDFADATDMWHNRGIAQLLEPLEASVESPAGIPYSLSKGTIDKSAFQYKGYNISEAGRPVFKYEYAGINISDALSPAEEGQKLQRSISVSGQATESDVQFNIASGKDIHLLSNGLYRINGGYYVEFDEGTNVKVQLAELDDQKVLSVPLGEGNISYKILW